MKRKNESGEVVIEATIVVTICVFMVFMLISIGMYLYHASLVRIVVNKTASDIALVYPYLDKEPMYGYTNYYDYMDNSPYRSFGVFTSYKFNKRNEEKATWYAYGLLEDMSLSADEFKDASVEVYITGSESAGKQRIRVYITDPYHIPLGGKLMGMVGLPETVEITASASADVFDISDQAGIYNFLVKMTNKLGESIYGDFVAGITKWLQFINSVINDKEDQT